jgi:hypothetical protein
MTISTEEQQRQRQANLQVLCEEITKLALCQWGQGISIEADLNGTLCPVTQLFPGSDGDSINVYGGKWGEQLKEYGEFPSTTVFTVKLKEA